MSDSPCRDQESIVTADDVRDLNRSSVERSASIARIAGVAVTFVGGVLAVGWLWVAVRLQQRIGDGLDFGTNEPSSVSFAKRVDALVGSLGLLGTAALVVAIGFVACLLADYMQSQVGGSVTGFVEGDALPGDDVESDAE
jgi:hypothetical protein